MAAVPWQPHRPAPAPELNDAGAGAAESYHYAIGDLSDSTATGRHAAAGGQVARTAARSAASNGCPPVSIVGRPGASRDSGPSRSAGRAPAAEPESGSTPAPERDSETVESRGPRVPEMPEQQVSLQELESELDRYIHDVENGATVVVSRDGRQVARIIPETDSAEQKRAALKASGTFDWSGRRPKSRRPSVRLRDGGSVSDIIINERR